LVTFTTDPDITEAGVRAGAYEFGSWPTPGTAPGARFSLFAFPFDVPAGTAPLVYARDAAGNEQTARFSFRVFPKKFRRRDIELSDNFLRKVNQNIGPHAPQLQLTGDLLGDFLKINRALREQNRRQLASMAGDTAEAFLWTKPFRQLANSKVEAEFADHRRYFYQSKQVDEADHLGFDLAVTANVPVLAANDGRVIWADYLGIFGNCIVIDHGYSLQSIYGHLNSFAVKRGDSVKQGQEIGKSGSTGLAGGDHLHFSMQVQGMQVNPTEWWDPHWIHDRIFAKFPGEKLPVGAPVKTAASAP
jgi:murein DD-endopeptidase MepM/ murein hydrolase activator NlpD